MILIDPRVGSKDLYPPLKSFRYPVKLSPLEYGDVAFTGRGPDERPVLVGVEVKKIGDVLSCIQDGRFAGHQLPGLQQSFEVYWLLVEGLTRAGKGGLEIHGSRGWYEPQGRRMSYAAFIHWMLTMEIRGGCRIARTADRAETVAWVASLYTWWTEKKWDKHESVHAIHDDPGELKPYMVALLRPTKRQMIAAKLLGAKTGLEALKHFGCITNMVLATEKEWMEVKGVGRERAREAMRLLHEGGV